MSTRDPALMERDEILVELGGILADAYRRHMVEEMRRFGRKSNQDNPLDVDVRLEAPCGPHKEFKT